MEESMPRQAQDSEYQEPTEEQGGIRRRLRDRELLKKRKAEAEEKDTNQWLFGEDSPRKKARAETKGRRGRPRKAEVPPAQDQVAPGDGAPAVLLVPAPQELQTSEALTISGQGSQSDLFSDPVQVDPTAVPIPTLSVDSTPTLAPLSVVSSIAADVDPVFQVTQVLVGPAPTLATASVVAPVDPDPVGRVPDDPSSASSLPSDATPNKALDLQEPPLAASGDSSVSQTDAAPPSIVPVQEETVSMTPQKKDLIDPVIIEDVGPDENEDVPPSQEDKVDQDVTALNNTTEPKAFMQPSSLLQQQDYLPGK